MRARSPRGSTRPATLAEEIARLDAKAKHAFAALFGMQGVASHQAKDPGLATLEALDPLDGSASLAASGARFLIVRAVAEAHFLNVSTSTRDGVHAGLVALSGVDTDVTTLSDVITRVNELKLKLIEHATALDVHFGDDTDLAALHFVTDPPTNQTQTNSAINDLHSALQSHLERHIEDTYA